VHFVPHGQINTVTNLTHGWSRAVFEIGVAYKERVDEVIEILTRLGTELRQDENFRLLILDGPVMLGVDSLSSSSVNIKFHMQTRPLQQWPVKR
jgi:small conductance mechanosensitive channel